MSKLEKKGYLLLENGTIFPGTLVGYYKFSPFEIVFNTAMTGYIETLTDPSYCGQGVVFTYPLIGNYGVMLNDSESKKVWVSAIIVKELASFSSNFRSTMDLNTFLIKNKIPGIQDINTRALTKIIRDSGVMKAVIIKSLKDKNNALKKLKNMKPFNPVNLVECKKPTKVGDGKIKIALLDFGVKENIVRSLLKYNTSIVKFPSTTPIKDILKIKPDGIVLSNGPGDPKDNKFAINTIKKLYDTDIPILGICLGHQLLALATKANTKKLKYGHRGPNHPVRYDKNKRVYITSQNHGYYVDEATIDKKTARVIFTNVNDNTIEGLKYLNKRIVTVQFHPEACAGPQDTSFIFKDFIDTIKTNKD